VTRGGKPIPGVTVMFRPDNPKGQVYLGGTGPEGHFTLMSVYSKFGVEPGEYAITFNTPEGSGGGVTIPQRLMGAGSAWRIKVADAPLDIELDVLKDQPQ